MLLIAAVMRTKLISTLTNVLTSGASNDSSQHGIVTTFVTQHAVSTRKLASRAQIDKLGERLKGAEHDRQVFVDLARFRNDFITNTEAVAQTVAAATKRFKVDITQRPAKSTASIIAKLEREHCRLSQIQDIGGLRVIVSKTSVQDQVVAIIAAKYPGCRVVDRRLLPQHGYRAVHVIVKTSDCLIEVQVRTLLQNGWAQYSEKLADLYDSMIKYGGGSAPIQEGLAYRSRVTAEIEELESEADRRKKDGMNELFRKKRLSGTLSTTEAADLNSYQELRANIRSVRKAW